MPTVSLFFGILIRMYFDDHNPPHFHVQYGDHEAEIAIQDGALVSGSLPRTALRLVEEWRVLHEEELLHNWELAKNLQLPQPIAPLE